MISRNVAGEGWDGDSQGETGEDNKNASEDLVSRVEAAVEDIRQGKFVVVQDAESRENEGDLIIAAEKV